ncbi:MAG: hypothetical protein J0L60_06515 [Ignavibacteria bacterium]|nr:hypothetical protein [Ignavibacteria bacterium]
MATSKFLRLFLTNAWEPLLGATIYLVPQANSYPTGAILLTAHPTRSGIYEADGVAHGEYKIYIGSGTPTLYTEKIWVGENFITIIADKFDVVTNQLTTAGIMDNAVTAAKIGSGQVTSTHVAAENINAAHLASNAVTTAKIIDGAVTEAKLASNSVSSGKIVDGSVTAAKIATGAVTETKIGALAVTTGKIADGAITSIKLANDAVNGTKIEDNSVSANKLAENAVTELKIANSAVTANKIATNAVTTDKIINAGVTDLKIANGAVTELKLATDSVSTSKIVNDAVTKAKLNPDVIDPSGLLAQNLDGSLKVDVDGVSLGTGYGYQLSILDGGVDKSHINSNVAGAGLGKNLDGALEVKTDGVSLEVVSDQIRLKRKEIYGILQFSGGGRSFTQSYNSAGVTLSVTRDDVGVYSITVSGSVLTVSKTVCSIQALVPAQIHIGIRRYSDTVIRIESEDPSGSAVDLDGSFYLSVVVFP